MAGLSPTQRTLKYMRDKGWVVAVTERWNFHAKIRQDLFGFIDILALGVGVICGIQCTSGANMAARIRKIKESEDAKCWLLAGGWIQVVGWRKILVHGKKKWQPRRVRLTYSFETGEWQEREIE